MNNTYNACNNLSVSTSVSTFSGVARYFKKSALNELAGVNLRICPADDELKRQKKKRAPAALGSAGRSSTVASPGLTKIRRSPDCCGSCYSPW